MTLWPARSRVAFVTKKVVKILRQNVELQVWWSRSGYYYVKYFDK